MSARHRDVLVAALERLNLDLDEDEIEYVASGAVEDDERSPPGTPSQPQASPAKPIAVQRLMSGQV